ncbi:S24 family peptidase [uncultured Sphingomonas sp.]|uniref:S24 family peptidase n=1 Tax=uncultured Sphingomonas sp. TaxID=158754 RepID=UPI0025D4981F|nr:S24 family peptidase [uncultured Sphingomonas sp.]
MNPTDQRAVLDGLIARDGVSLSTLSRVVGRNAAWMQQYMRRGTPKLLPERERGLIAGFFGVDDSVLGGATPPAIVRVPRLAVSVSAGPGRLVTSEATVASAGYAAEDLARLGIRVSDAAILDVRGDSMQPTLIDGDRILVDRGQRVPGKAQAIWVLRCGDELLVKRLTRDGDDWLILSDNAPDRRIPLSDVEVLGRVVELVRRL